MTQVRGEARGYVGIAAMIVAVLARSATTTSAASAAAPEFKPATKQAFTGTSGALTIEFSSAETVACSKGGERG